MRRNRPGPTVASDYPLDSWQVVSSAYTDRIAAGSVPVSARGKIDDDENFR
jgi:hypothetical protein